MNMLTHTPGLTRVSAREVLMESDERPDLPFAFDALYYEPPTGLAFKVLAGEQVLLTESEIADCNAFCDTFLDTADYPVHTFDETDIYVGTMMRSEAQAGKLRWRLTEAPEHPASKWTGTAWERVVTSILDDGRYILNPDGICEHCVLALTAAEWAVFPAVPVTDHGEEWRWDFTAGAWKDVTDPGVFAFDEVGAFVGMRKRSYVLGRGWGFTFDAPEHQASVWTGTAWERLTAAIHEDGNVTVRPEAIRDDAVVLFTREEWARWPARPASPNGEVWAWDFRAESWRDVSQAYVAAYEKDGDQVGLFAGGMMRSEAESRGYGWTRTFPDTQTAKWTGEGWEPIFAVIMDDGAVRLEPDGICQRCMLVFTKEEWAASPRPAWDIPRELGGWYWNFVLERWEDRRETAKLRREAVNAARYVLNWRREPAVHCLGGWAELSELTMVAAEIRTMQADADASTPYLSACFAALPEYAGITREAFVATVLEDYARMAGLCGRQAARLRGIECALIECATNAEIDTVFTAAFAAAPSPDSVPETTEV